LTADASRNRCSSLGRTRGFDLAAVFGREPISSRRVTRGQPWPALAAPTEVAVGGFSAHPPLPAPTPRNSSWDSLVVFMMARQSPPSAPRSMARAY